MSITYDTMGNPLTDGTWTYTWEHGRQLASMTDGTTTWTYTYDANGLRSKRTNGTDTYTYVYNGSKLMQMKKGAYTLDFTYDASGNPSTVTLNGATYYYITNLQGDVTEIRDSSGNLVCEYSYDAWGKVISRSDNSNHLIDDLNPLLYRGYVYDTDTGLYYLQSRYYNPTIGRFLNADAYTSTGQGVLGNNMFSYCGNNPANRADPTGNAFVQVAYNFDSVSNSMFLILGGGGGGTAYALVCASMCARPIKEFKDKVNCSDEAEVFRNLKKNGFAFYNGTPVFMTELPIDKSAFSIGMIVIDNFYKDVSSKDFAKLLNHEYGHTKHMQQIGPLAYAITTAVPSLIFAGISEANIPGVSQFISDNYYNLPWERIADYLGGVNRGYATGANTTGTLYWAFTVWASFAMH